MPNWCENDLKVSATGKKAIEQLDSFNRKIQDQEKFFSNFIPTPEELLASSPHQKHLSQKEWEKDVAERVKTFLLGRNSLGYTPQFRLTKELSKHLFGQYGADNWYDWNCNNYGCKWDVEIRDKEVLDKEINIMFDSPWSPPIAGIIKLSYLFPLLKFQLIYFEPGCDFGGILTVKNGKANDNDTNNGYKKARDWFGYNDIEE